MLRACPHVRRFSLHPAAVLAQAMSRAGLYRKSSAELLRGTVSETFQTRFKTHPAPRRKLPPVRSNRHLREKPMTIAKKSMIAVTIALITTLSSAPTFANPTILCTPVCWPHLPAPPPPPPPPPWIYALGL